MTEREKQKAKLVEYTSLAFLRFVINLSLMTCAAGGGLTEHNLFGIQFVNSLYNIIHLK